MVPVKIEVDDILVMKKKHPCGSDTFRVMRIGSDIGMECTACKRSVLVPRIKIEKYIKEVKSHE